MHIFKFLATTRAWVKNSDVYVTRTSTSVESINLFSAKTGVDYMKSFFYKCYLFA